MNIEEKQKSEREIGFVVAAKNYLLTLEGLPGARLEDILYGENGKRALVISLRGKLVKAMLLDRGLVRPGDMFALREEKNFFSFGDHLFGKVVNALGEPIESDISFPEPNMPFVLEVEARGMGKRGKIHEQLVTGITMVDTLLPIAKGQRQLIHGPVRSGKTSFLGNVLASQKELDTVCIYAAIGRPATLLQPLAHFIYKESGNPKTIIVAAFSDEPTPMIAIAPSTAMHIAEHFALQGKSVLLIIDDFSVHAKYLREIALLAGRLPGRESYPGDIFYQHAHVIERAGKFSQKEGGGSITLLAVLETDIESYSDYIPTNLMAATDGHLFFSPELYAEGVYPPLREDQSVTRVGKNSQKFIQKQLATRILSILTEYRREREYSQFTAVTNERTKKILHQGELLYELLRQNTLENLPIFIQTTLLTLAFLPFLLNRDTQFLLRNKPLIIAALKKDHLFNDLKTAIQKDILLEEFIELAESKIPLLEKVCQQ